MVPFVEIIFFEINVDPNRVLSTLKWVFWMGPEIF